MWPDLSVQLCLRAYGSSCGVKNLRLTISKRLADRKTRKPPKLPVSSRGAPLPIAACRKYEEMSPVATAATAERTDCASRWLWPAQRSSPEMLLLLSQLIG